MLAAHRPAEFEDEVGNLGGDRSKFLDVLIILRIQDRTDVQATDVGMPVA